MLDIINHSLKLIMIPYKSQFIFSFKMEPIIKVRHKEKLAILFVTLLSTVLGMPQCDKSPHEQGTEKHAGDNGFSIHVRGTPRKYRPNEVYTIELKVSSSILKYLHFQKEV